MTNEELIEHNLKYHTESYPRDTKFIEKRLEDKLIELKIDRTDVVVKFEPFDEWIKPVYTREYVDDIKFTAWSKDYIFVVGKYDGHYWIQEVPRNPSDKLAPQIGGG